MSAINGIDVSKWQGNIDFQKVKNSRIKFTIIREGYGKKSPNQIDKMFKNNYEKAKSVGLNVGCYHYSYAESVSDAKNEAEFCLENIKGMKFEYPICFDIEDKEQLKLNNRQRTDIVKTFCDEIEKAGYYAMFYCNLNWLNNYLYQDELVNKYDLWLAQWKTAKPVFIPGIWQYSEIGQISGINGNVDFDLAYKDYPSIIKAKGLNGFTKNTSSAPQYYVVVKGDNLTKIANKYNTSVDQLVSWNNIKNKNLINIGQRLRIK